MYQVIATHDGLEKSQVLMGTNLEDVQRRANELADKWAKQYDDLIRLETGEQAAKEFTNAYQTSIDALQNYLVKSLEIDYAIDKNKEKEISFEEQPQLKLLEYPTVPDENDKKYYKKPINENKLSSALGEIGFITTIIFFVIYWDMKGFLSSVLATTGYFFAFAFISLIIDSLNKPKFIKEWYMKDKHLWEENCKVIDIQNAEIEKKHNTDMKIWNKSKKLKDKEIDEFFEAYDKGIEDGVIFMVEKWLAKIDNLKEYKNNNIISYNPQNNILVIDYFVPDIEFVNNIPKTVKYNKSKGEFQQIYYSEKDVQKLYNSLIYQIIFSVVNAIFSGDIKGFIKTVVVNSYIETLDKSLGKEVVICIASLMVNKEAFNELNLKLIDPKECFKRLKGLSSIQLQNKIPVKPIMKLNKDDKRFIESYDVSKNIDGQTNLASMDWQDFENLIRELFEKKFSRHGGECKVTQASRDGGVDAVAFDPDPILGGKIIIQAKRYTNIVGVSAVRDLYGTLINEGASKGILITTADFGSDAHKFAEGKPIVLINGNNLLQLLEEELQTKAYINITEAKKILKETEK